MYNFVEDKILIVGAGLAGSTLARILAENSFKVVIIEKRNHIAGNVFDFVNKNNERIHKYGPHLLHCRKNSDALKFLSRFTEWVEYKHKVRALLKDGRTTPLPVNKLTIEDVFGKYLPDEKATKEFLDNIRNTNLIPKNTDELFESTVGNKLADIFFRPYTKKMWGMDPKKLSISIGARLPVRINDDCRYFNDEFQALPKDGYTEMVNKMLDHKNIEIYLDTPFIKGMESQLTIALMQLDCIWENSSENQIRLQTLLGTVPAQSDVVLLPEMFNTGFSMNPQKVSEPMGGSTVRWMRDWAFQNKKVLS